MWVGVVGVQKLILSAMLAADNLASLVSKMGSMAPGLQTFDIL